MAASGVEPRFRMAGLNSLSKLKEKIKEHAKPKETIPGELPSVRNAQGDCRRFDSVSRRIQDGSDRASIVHNDHDSDAWRRLRQGCRYKGRDVQSDSDST